MRGGKVGGGGGGYVCLHFSSGLFITDSSLMDWERAWRAGPTSVTPPPPPPPPFGSDSLQSDGLGEGVEDGAYVCINLFFPFWFVSDRWQSDGLGEGVEGGAYVGFSLSFFLLFFPDSLQSDGLVDGGAYVTINLFFPLVCF